MTRSSGPGGQIPDHRSRVRSRSRSPSARPGPRRRAPRAACWPAARQPDEDPGGQPPGGGAQLAVGGAGQVGQQGHGGVRVGGQQPGERLLVELAQARRDLRERRVPGGQLGPADAPPGGPRPRSRRAADAEVGAGWTVGGWRGPGRPGPGWGLPRRRQAVSFSPAVQGPGAGSSGAPSSGGAADRALAGQSSSSSSSSTDSGVRSQPSAIRIRPDSAACAASRAVARVMPWPRRAAGPARSAAAPGRWRRGPRSPSARRGAPGWPG